MNRPLDIALTLLRVGFAGSVAYRAEIVIWMLTTTLPLVMLAIWSAMAAEAPVRGFDEGEFVAYFMLNVLVRHLTGCWVVWNINEEVRDGSLSMRLLRPLHPFLNWAGEILGALPIRSAIVVPVVATVLLLHEGPDVTDDPLRWILFALAVAGAWLLTFCIQAILGTLAFWTEQSLSLFDVFFGAWALLSGYLIPNALLPETLQRLNAVLPFWYMLGFPVELALGHLTPAEGLRGLALMAAWILTLAAAAHLLWRSGVRRYEAWGS